MKKESYSLLKRTSTVALGSGLVFSSIYPVALAMEPVKDEVEVKACSELEWISGYCGYISNELWKKDGCIETDRVKDFKKISEKVKDLAPETGLLAKAKNLLRGVRDKVVSDEFVDSPENNKQFLDTFIEILIKKLDWGKKEEIYLLSENSFESARKFLENMRKELDEVGANLNIENVRDVLLRLRGILKPYEKEALDTLRKNINGLEIADAIKEADKYLEYGSVGEEYASRDALFVYKTMRSSYVELSSDIENILENRSFLPLPKSIDLVFKTKLALDFMNKNIKEVKEKLEQDSMHRNVTNNNNNTQSCTIF